MFKVALIHGLKVAGHIVLAMVVAIVGYYLFDQNGLSQLYNWLEHAGLQVGLINVIIATAIKYYQQIPQIPQAPTTTPEPPVSQ